MHDHPRLAGGVQVQTALPCYDRELKPIAATIIMTSYGNDHRNIDKSKKKKRERERKKDSNGLQPNGNGLQQRKPAYFDDFQRVLSSLVHFLGCRAMASNGRSGVMVVPRQSSLLSVAPSWSENVEEVFQRDSSV